MPDFSVTVLYRLELATTLTVKARDRESAEEKVQKMIDDGKAGTLYWEVTDRQGQFKKVDPEEAVIEIKVE